jgi:hypothetical protein
MFKQIISAVLLLGLISCNANKSTSTSNEVTANNPKDDKWWKEE